MDAGTNATPFVTPPLHVYDTAPVPFSVTDVPAQTADAGDVVEETVGVGFTVIVVVAVFVQPFTSVPVTVYVLVVTALNATAFVTPPVHEYVLAPVPFNVTIVPEQTVVAGEAVEETVGNGFTVTVALPVCVCEQVVLLASCTLTRT